MKANTPYLFGALFAAGCLITGLLWPRDGKRGHVVSATTTNSTKVNVAAGATQSAIPAAEPPKPGAKRMPPSELISDKNRGANGALAKFAFSHPEFGLSEQAVADLQQIFLRHYQEYTTFAGKVALARKQDDGSVWIQIPAAPFHVMILQDEFLEDVDAYYGGRTDSTLRAALAELFAGFANDTGKMAVELVVRASDDPRADYELSRRAYFVEDGKIVAVARGEDVLSRANIESSGYAGVSHYFPPSKR